MARHHKTRLDPLRERVAELWAQRLSMSEIGEAVGKTKNAICGLVHRMKLKCRRSPISNAAPSPRWTPAQRSQALQMKLDGQSYSQIALKFGISTGAVFHRLRTALRAALPAGERAVPRAPRLLVADEGRRSRGTDEITGHTLPGVAHQPIASPFVGRITECTYLLSSGRPWIYCDKPTLPAKSMCHEHHALCFRSVEGRRTGGGILTPAPGSLDARWQFNADARARRATPRLRTHQRTRGELVGYR